MFAKIVHHFLNTQGLLKIEKKDTSILSKTLMPLMIFYQQFSEEKKLLKLCKYFMF